MPRPKIYQVRLTDEEVKKLKTKITDPEKSDFKNDQSALSDYSGYG